MKMFAVTTEERAQYSFFCQRCWVVRSQHNCLLTVPPPQVFYYYSNLVFHKSYDQFLLNVVRFDFGGPALQLLSVPVTGLSDNFNVDSPFEISIPHFVAICDLVVALVYGIVPLWNIISDSAFDLASILKP